MLTSLLREFATNSLPLTSSVEVEACKMTFKIANCQSGIKRTYLHNFKIFQKHRKKLATFLFALR